jgi:hypothetical protein
LYFAGSGRLKVFMAPVPGQRFAQTANVGSSAVKVTGNSNGQAVVIRAADREFIVAGYRCSVTFTDPAFVWPSLKTVHVERGRWQGSRWIVEGAPSYGINESAKTLDIDLDTPQAVRVSW